MRQRDLARKGDLERLAQLRGRECARQQILGPGVGGGGAGDADPAALHDAEVHPRLLGDAGGLEAPGLEG
ncbi:MAG: hypothetical protein AUH46_01865 [Gemmatimonadetes bacterium 13_1_40CM_70_15]|nr:MAG: hypothetical protein AUH46_01865 [Gemmatimonadetes bacterium 13_1_40CM_70_15]